MASKNITIKDFQKELPGNIPDNDPITYVFPEINSINQHGSKTSWIIIVRVVDTSKKDPAGETFVPLAPLFAMAQLPPEFAGWIKVLSRVEQGKIRSSDVTYVKSGKNVGKANETNIFTQALRDALSKYNKQAQKAKEEMKLNGDKKNTEKTQLTLYAPMLAQPASDLDFFGTVPITQEKTAKTKEPAKTQEITAPQEPIKTQKTANPKVFVQRKYDGVRIVSAWDGERVVMYSRAKHIYPQFTEIKEQLVPIFKHFENRGIKLYLDGELYKHGISLQNISGVARREKTQQDISLDYYIFDCFIPEQPKLNYSERKEFLNEAKDLFKPPNVVYVETFQVDSAEEIKALYQRFLTEGYEGAMIRLDKPYKYSANDYHSPWLLKMKPEKDAEFKIIDYTKAEKGKSEGALMFILETPTGKHFSINLSGGSTIKELKDLYVKMGQKTETGSTVFEQFYKGKKLIVYFDDLSTDGIPVRARVKGIVLRDYE